MIFDWEDFCGKDRAGNEEQRRKERIFRNTNTTWDDKKVPVETLGGMVLERSPSPDDLGMDDSIDRRYFYKHNENVYEYADMEDPANVGRKHFGIPPYRKATHPITLTDTQKFVLNKFPPETSFKAEKILQRRGNDDNDGANYEYLVKWHWRSYRDSTWIPRNSIPFSMIKGRKKHDVMISTLKAQGCPNPEEVAALKGFGYGDQMPHVPEEPMYTVGNALTLVKWTNAPYNEGTWEQSDTVHFRRRPPGVLQEYQKDAIKWLLERWAARKSCVLADEPGLGRRVQAVVALDQIRMSLHGGSFLILVPETSMTEWKRALDKWTSLRSMPLLRMKKDRIITDRLLFEGPFWEDEATSKYDVLIMSHKMFHIEYENIKKVKWSYVIVEDQSVHLKEKILSSNFEYVLVVADGPKGKEWANALSISSNYLPVSVLERTKETIFKGISECTKVEQVVLIEQTPNQRKDIKEIIESNIVGLVRGDLPAYSDAVTRILRSCNHTNTKSFSEDTGKMSFMYRFVYEMIVGESNSKMLILASSNDALEYLEKYLNWIEVPNVNLRSGPNITKDMIKAAKVILADKARTNPARIPKSERELIDTAIIYESDINPIADNLKVAEYCPVREGKTPVKVYRLITKGTCEHYALAALSGQRRIFFEELSKALKYSACNAYRKTDAEGDPQKSAIIEHVIDPLCAYSYKKLCFANTREEEDFNAYINDPYFWANISLLDGDISEFQLPEKKKSRLLCPNELLQKDQQQKTRKAIAKAKANKTGKEGEEDKEEEESGKEAKKINEKEGRGGDKDAKKTNEKEGGNEKGGNKNVSIDEEPVHPSPPTPPPLPSLKGVQIEIGNYVDSGCIRRSTHIFNDELLSALYPHQNRNSYNVRRELSLYGWGNWARLEDALVGMTTKEVKQESVTNVIMALNSVVYKTANGFTRNVFGINLPQTDRVTAAMLIAEPTFKEFQDVREEVGLLFSCATAEKFLKALELSTFVHRAAQGEIEIKKSKSVLAADWTDQDDMDLLREFDRWGFPNYDLAFSNDKLPFVKKLLIKKGKSKVWPVVVKRRVHLRIRSFFTFALTTNVKAQVKVNERRRRPYLIKIEEEGDSEEEEGEIFIHEQQRESTSTVMTRSRTANFPEVSGVSEIVVDRKGVAVGDEEDGYDIDDDDEVNEFDSAEFEAIYSNFNEDNDLYRFFLGQENCPDAFVAYRILQYGAFYGFPHRSEGNEWHFDYGRIAGVISRHNKELERRAQVTPAEVQTFLKTFVETPEESPEFPGKSILLNRISFFGNVEYVANSKTGLSSYMSAIDFSEDYPFPKKDSLWMSKEWDKAAIKGVVMYGLHAIWSSLRKDASSPFYNARDCDIPTVGELIQRFNRLFEKAGIKVNPREIRPDNVKRDNFGNVILPVVTNNGIVLESVGEAVPGWNPLFMSGYVSMKVLNINEKERRKYVCSVLKNDNGNPVFHVENNDCTHIGKTPLAAWRSILYELHYKPEEMTEKLAMGYFGFTDPTVVNLIIDGSRILPK